MSDRSNTKYGDQLEDHDWSEESEVAHDDDRVKIKNHEIDVILVTDPTEKYGYGREKYTATIRYDDDIGSPYVLYVVEHRWKGNYWRDVTDWDWKDVPTQVRNRIAAVLPVDSAEALDSGARLIDEGGESRWEKHHKHKVEGMDSGEMWGSSFLGDAIDSAESAAEALNNRELDAENVEQAIEELQRAKQELNEVEQ